MKIELTKDECLRLSKREGNSEVGAGKLAPAKPDIEKMRMLLKLVCLGDARAAADLDNRLRKLS